MDKPNIVYLHSSETGRFVQPYGAPVFTPNIQRLAEEGTLFRNAFAASSTPSPSRAALLTGLWPHINGMIGPRERGFALRDARTHIVNLLRDAGYHSTLAGNQEIAAEAGTIGYNAIPKGGSIASEHVVDFFDRCPCEPFFLDIGFNLTRRIPRLDASAQRPFIDNVKLPYGNVRHCHPPAPLPDTPETRLEIADFIVAVRELDHQFGIVLHSLQKSGLDKNTVVICTTDTGMPFPFMKGTVTDLGVGVMLIVRGPGGFEGGRVFDALVSQIDILPTIFDLASIDVPPALTGQSLVPLVQGRLNEVHPIVYAQQNYHSAYEPVRMARSRRWKYVRRFDDHEHICTANVQDSLAKQVLMKAGWGQTSIQRESLFDLMLDPQETRNVIDDPYATTALIEVRDAMDTWMKQSVDPILNGRIPHPTNAIVNPSDSTTSEHPKVHR